MSSASLPSLFIATDSRRSFRAPMVSVGALRLTFASLTQHSLKTLNANTTASKFPCQSTCSDVSHSNHASSSSSSSSFPKYDRLLPCPPRKLPPRVEHLVVTEEGCVRDVICGALDLPPLFVVDLIRFGAVHYALVHPQPPPSATPEQMAVFREATSPLALRRRKEAIKGKTLREAQKTYRITDSRQIVEAGTFLRVHVHPKRYPRCYEVDWKSRVIAVEKSFVVLDKPAGTSVGGNIDNLVETCTAFVTRALGFTTTLRITHQIDNCTEGCVVLARTKEFSSSFNRKIGERTVKKLYLALAAAPLPTGIVTHYMRPTNKAPRLVSHDRIEGWSVCELEIMECRKIPWPSSFAMKKNCGEDCHWPKKDYAYECKINLLTGRTHQIRAQLAALGAPIVGDSAYMPAVLAERADPGVNPFGKCGRQYPSEDDKEAAVKEWIDKHGKEPSISLGLQACQISWDNGERLFKAGAPWWRSKEA